MESKNAIDGLNKLADQMAEQITLLQGFDKFSAQTFIKEIKREKNIITKYTKLFHVLIDKSRNKQRNKEINNDNSMDNLIQQVQQIASEVPGEATEFVPWIIRYMKKQSSLITNFQERLNSYRKQLDDTIENSQDVYELRQELKKVKQQLKIEKTRNDNISVNSQTISLEKKVQHYEEAFSAMKERMSSITTTIQQLRNDIEIKNSKIDSLRKENRQLRDSSFSSDQDDIRQQLEQEREINRIREQKLNEMKIKFSQFGDDLLKKEECLKKQQQNIDEQIKEIESNKDIINNYHELKENYDQINVKYSIVYSELQRMKDHYQSNTQKFNSNEQAVSQLNFQLKQQHTENDALRAQIRDVNNIKNQISEELSNAMQRIKSLEHECVRLETNITKTKDYANRTESKLHLYEDDALTVKRFGFLLADATSQRFNPAHVESEIERLIEVIRTEHIELSETRRVHLNPYSEPNYPVFSDINNGDAIHSKFDELNQEITNLQLSMSHS